MSKNNGYTYIGPSRAAFDALTGRLPQPHWCDLPPLAKAWIVVATFGHKKRAYTDPNGFLRGSFASAAREILDEPDAASGQMSILSTIAVRKGLLQKSADGHLKLAPNEDMRSLLEDVGLYQQSPEYLPPEVWEKLWEHGHAICESPMVGRSGTVAAALAYILANLAGAHPPV